MLSTLTSPYILPPHPPLCLTYPPLIQRKGIPYSHTPVNQTTKNTITTCPVQVAYKISLQVFVSQCSARIDGSQETIGDLRRSEEPG